MTMAQQQCLGAGHPAAVSTVDTGTDWGWG